MAMVECNMLTSDLRNPLKWISAKKLIFAIGCVWDKFQFYRSYCIEWHDGIEIMANNAGNSVKDNLMKKLI